MNDQTCLHTYLSLTASERVYSGAMAVRIHEVTDSVIPCENCVWVHGTVGTVLASGHKSSSLNQLWPGTSWSHSRGSRGDRCLGLTSVIRRVSSSENAVFLPVGWSLSLAVSLWQVYYIMASWWEKRFLAAEVEMKPTCNVLVVPHKLVQEKMLVFPTTLQLSAGNFSKWVLAGMLKSVFLNGAS